MLGHAVGRRAEQVVAQEVAAVAEDHEVEAPSGCEVRDDLGGMPGAQLDGELDPGLLGLLTCPKREGVEEEVLLPLDLVNLAHGRRVRGKRPFDRERRQLRIREVRELECLRERPSGRGWKKRWAIAVGTIAERTTTAIRSENFVRSMIPALSP